MIQARTGRMGAMAASVLALGLAGCEAPSWGPSWNFSSGVRAPTDSLTVQRVMGREPAAPAEPLASEPARWLVEERPRATLANPDQALQGVPTYEPVPRPEVDRNLREPRRRPGSSSIPALPQAEALPAAPPARAEAPRLPATPGGVDGRVVFIPGQAPAVVTGGADRYQTFQQPNTAGGGLLIPQGDGTALVIGPDGRAITVPLPR